MRPVHGDRRDTYAGISHRLHIGSVYTMAGGMWSVAYTSVIQVIIILLGLFLVPFRKTVNVGK